MVLVGRVRGWSLADLAAVVSAGVACLLCRLLPLPLVVFVAPIPPTPFPAGRGRLKVYFAGGYRPRHPGIKPSTALTAPATQAPLRGSGLFSTRIPVAPVCAIALFNAERTGFPQAKPVPRPHPARGCKGRSPLHEITLVSPFPPGRGVGGWGQQSKLKAGVAGDKEGKPPRRVQRRQGQPAPQGASPAGCVVRPHPQCRPGSAAGHLHGKGCTCRRRFRAGVPGAKPPAK